MNDIKMNVRNEKAKQKESEKKKPVINIKSKDI